LSGLHVFPKVSQLPSKYKIPHLLVEPSFRTTTRGSGFSTGLNSKYANLLKGWDQLQAEIDAQAITDQDIAEALNFQQAVKAGLQNPTWEDKRYYLERMRFEAVIIDIIAHFSCYLDLEGSSFELQSRVYS
jgi:hypothetical protein